MMVSDSQDDQRPPWSSEEAFAAYLKKQRTLPAWDAGSFTLTQAEAEELSGKLQAPCSLYFRYEADCIINGCVNATLEEFFKRGRDIKDWLALASEDLEAAIALLPNPSDPEVWPTAVARWRLGVLQFLYANNSWVDPGEPAAVMKAQKRQQDFIEDLQKIAFRKPITNQRLYDLYRHVGRLAVEMKGQICIGSNQNAYEESDVRTPFYEFALGMVQLYSKRGKLSLSANPNTSDQDKAPASAWFEHCSTRVKNRALVDGLRRALRNPKPRQRGPRRLTGAAKSAKSR